MTNAGVPEEDRRLAHGTYTRGKSTEQPTSLLKSLGVGGLAGGGMGLLGGAASGGRRGAAIGALIGAGLGAALGAAIREGDRSEIDRVRHVLSGGEEAMRADFSESLSDAVDEIRSDEEMERWERESRDDARSRRLARDIGREIRRDRYSF